MNPTVRFLVAFPLLCAATAAAQNLPPTPTPAPEGYRHYALGTITVTEDAPPVDVVDVDVMAAEEIEARNARTVAEALETVPGIRVSTGRKAEPRVSVHGFDQSKVLVLVDGVPYYETTYGQLDLNQIPTANIARIEVSKGAASVVYGANAMGGVVNIITKQPADTPFTGVTAELGSNGIGNVSLTHGGRRGKLGYWLNYSHQERDGWDLSEDFESVEGRIVYRGPSSTVPALLQREGERTNSDVERDAAWFKFGLDNGPDSAYWVNLHYLNMSKGLPPATDEVRVFLSPPAFSHLARMPDYRDTGIDLDMRQRLADGLVLKGKLFYHDHEDNYDSYPDLDYTDRLTRSTFQNYAEVRIRGLELAGSVQAAEGLLVSAHVTWTDVADRSAGRVTEDVVNVPELTGHLAVRWQLPRVPARLDLGGTWMDEVFTSLPSPLYPNDPTQRVDAVFLVAARLGWDVTPNLELWGAGRNLLDEDYESEYAYPGPGRELSAGLTASF